MVRESRRGGPKRFYKQPAGFRDPYLPKQAIPEPAQCKNCQALYYRRHWSVDLALARKFRKVGNLYDIICPACRKIADHYPMGILYLQGKFTADHGDELVHLVNGEERRAREKNPLERLMGIRRVDGGLQVETTTDILAMRIARLLHRAYKGNLAFHFKRGDKHVTVNWRREE